MTAPDTIRMRLTLHYDGSAFHGWQRQPRDRSVQGVLEGALSRLAAQPRTVIGAGRTDTGVHATGQVASVDMPSRWTGPELKRSLNAILPPDVWVEDARATHPDFHPRYDAVARTYHYFVGVDPSAASPFHRGWCWPLAETLDEELLSRATGPLVGDQSFRAFAKAGQPERGDRCVVADAGWARWALGVRFSITADRYLHHMVRYLVGTIVDVARGRREAGDVPLLLAGAPGVLTSPPAPPEGLFLTKVEYAEVPHGHPSPRSSATA